MAIAVSAIVVCSPVARSTSISRSLGLGLISRASLIRPSVTPLIAETTHDDAIPRLLGGDHAARDVEDALGSADGGAAVFLHDQGHGEKGWG